MKKQLIILKIGGSVITHKTQNIKKIHQKNLDRICAEIAKSKKKNDFSLVIVYGVGSFGHIIAKKFKLNEGYKNKSQIKPISDVHLDLLTLNIAVIKTLKKHGLMAVSILPSSAWKLTDGEMIGCEFAVIKNFINLGLIPVLHGDLLTDESYGFKILSGDHIVVYLAKNLKADRVIIGTDTDGVFDSDPKINKNAKLIKQIDKNSVKNINIEGSQAIDVTGGMEGKVNELLKLANHKIESQIINISKPEILKKSLEGKEGLGTRIK